MTRVGVPALVTVLTVAAYLGVAGWNRSEAPIVRLTLTERELALPWSQPSSGDDPGLQLRLNVHHRVDPLDARNWLPETRLRDIGFSLEIPAGAPEARYTYRAAPDRRAWVVLEYDGPAWRELERRRALSADSGLWRGWPDFSRLVPVDAGRDVDALRRRYPEGHLILPAVIGVAFLGPDAGGPLVYGRLADVTPHTIAVPLALRPVFEDLLLPAGRGDDAPRYEVDVAVGPIGIPYITGARRLP